MVEEMYVQRNGTLNFTLDYTGFVIMCIRRVSHIPSCLGGRKERHAKFMNGRRPP